MTVARICRLLLMCWLLGLSRRSAADTAPTARQLNEQSKASLFNAPAKSLALARKAEVAAHAAGDIEEQAWAMTHQGSAYYVLEQYDDALRAYLRALAMHRRARNLRGESACLNNLGNLYYSHGQYRSAGDYYRRSMVIDRLRGDSSGVATSYVNLANVLALTHQLTEALAYSRRGLELARQVGNQQEEGSALNNLGSGYVELHRYAEALPYLRDALQLSVAMDDKRQQSVNLQTMADAYKGLRDWPKAIAYYRESSRVGHDFINTVRDNYKRLAEVQSASGDYAGAFASLRQHSILNDSIFSRETTDKLTEVEARYRTREQQQQIRAQRAALRAQTLALHQKNQLVALASGAAILLLLGAVGLGHQVRQKNRANRLLATANTEIQQVVAQKERLIQEVHHRVKNNLQMVSSLLTLQANANPAARAAVVESQARIQSMALVHEHLYRTDDLAHIRLDTYLGELLTSLHSAHASTSQPLELTTELAPLVVVAKDAIPLGLLVNELVTNAYKHAFRGRPSGHLHVSLEAPTVADDRPPPFCLRICDDGVGLGATATPPAASASLGMQLVRMFTRQLKATLTTSPQPQGGTCFEIRRS